MLSLVFHYFQRIRASKIFLNQKGECFAPLCPELNRAVIQVVVHGVLVLVLIGVAAAAEVLGVRVLRSCCCLLQRR